MPTLTWPAETRRRECASRGAPHQPAEQLVAAARQAVRAGLPGGQPVEGHEDRSKAIKHDKAASRCLGQETGDEAKEETGLDAASHRETRTRRLGLKGCVWRMATRKRLVPAVGFELTTYRLQGGCSTTELNRRARAF